MLRSEELDQESFDEILTSAVDKMNEYYPVWTDHNPSDPGMALLELMTWYTEVARYHLNVIGRENIYRYLKLLGYRPRGICPSKTILKVTGKGRLPRLSRFFADKLPFETLMELDVQDNEISHVSSGKERIDNRNHILEELDGTLQIYPFGKEEENRYFEIGFEKELPQKEVVGLYFHLRPVEGMARVEDAFEGILTAKAEYYDGEWKQGVEILRDDTKGFLRSGIVYLMIKGNVRACSSFRLRFFVEGGDFAQLPVVTGMVLNAVPAAQTYTNAGTEQLLVTAQGICDLRVKLEDQNILSDGLELWVRGQDGNFRWTQVEDFDLSDKEDRHYVYEEETAELVFGDGIHGCPPEGDILLMGYATSQGMSGNVKKHMVSSETDRFQAVNILPSEGGRDRETIEECYERLFEDRRELYRCITLQDFEQAVRSVPGFVVHRVHAFRGKENTVCICVETKGSSKRLNESCLGKVQEYLMPRVLLGTKVDFLQPQYVGIHVYLDVSVNPSYQDVKQLTQEALNKYFDGADVGFGCLIRKNELGRYVHGLPWIRGLKSMEFSAAGSGVTVMNNGDLRLADDCLPVVEHVVVNIVKFK